MQEVAKPWLFCCLPWCISWLNLNCSRVKVPLHWCWNPPASWRCKLIMCHGTNDCWGVGWPCYWLPLGGGWGSTFSIFRCFRWMEVENGHQLDDHEKVLSDFGWCSWLKGMMMQGVLSWRLGGLLTRVVCSYFQDTAWWKNLSKTFY